LQGAYVPVAEAAFLLARGRSEAAIDAARRAARYEFGTVAALTPLHVRGEAHLRAGAAQQALIEFRAVLEHRGADPFSALIPLSHLGAARALAQGGDRDESHRMYEQLLRIWASADPDLPVLQQARAELSRLARLGT
jgi:tetratricopeptide (TPR) repeat protein